MRSQRTREQSGTTRYIQNRITCTQLRHLNQKICRLLIGMSKHVGKRNCLLSELINNLSKLIPNQLLCKSFLFVLITIPFLKALSSNPLLRKLKSNMALVGRVHLETWRVVVDGRRTLQPLEISLLIKLYRKRSMGALISLGDPLDTTLPYNKGILSQHRQKSSKMAALPTYSSASS